MNAKLNGLLIFLAATALAIGMSVFTVDEREHAVKFQLGQIIRSDYAPGLHFKWPFLQRVYKFPNRILNFEDSEERFLTGEQKNLLVDYFVTWRVVDPEQYYVSVQGDEQAAVNRHVA